MSVPLTIECCRLGVHGLVRWVVPLFITRVGNVSWLRPFQIVRGMSSKVETNNDEVVLAEVINNKGLLTLNRPKVLNSLNRPMVDKLLQKLQEWENKLQCVIIKGSGEKAFCAGGDVRAITEGGPSNSQVGKDFFRKVFTMNYTIGQYKIPYVALIDGITMGGGVGVSVHGKYRIATEKTLFAMPEAAIGLFPDVGASYFLPRLEGKLGLYLALTGARLKGKDVVKIGIGTHYLESKDVPKLLDAILDMPQSGDLDAVIREHSQDVSNHSFSLASNMGIMNEAFSAPTVEEIVKRLEKDGTEFSFSTLKLLNRMSPISLKISKLELEKGAKLTLKECLQMEYRLVWQAFSATASADFYEGVRALLKDKDQNPKWNPAKLEDVTDEMVNKLFLPLAPENELKL